MSDLRTEAMKMALEFIVLASSKDRAWFTEKEFEVVAALRQALAQSEQEQPKHWSDCAVYNEPAYPKGECDCGGFDPNNKWHGLTEKEAESLAFDVIADGVSKILAQPEQEPVKYVDVFNVLTPTEVKTIASKPYTKPPKREWQNLTDDGIKEIVGPWGDTPIKGYTRKLFDQIEAKLKEKNT